MNIPLAATLLLITAAAIGVHLALLGMRKRKRSPSLGLTHAVLALSGLILLFVEIYYGPTNKLINTAAFFLFFAIVGGGIVFALHEEKRPPSMGAVTAHAIMGVVGVSLLVINLFG